MTIIEFRYFRFLKLILFHNYYWIKFTEFYSEPIEWFQIQYVLRKSGNLNMVHFDHFRLNLISFVSLFWARRWRKGLILARTEQKLTSKFSILEPEPEPELICTKFQLAGHNFELYEDSDQLEYNDGDTVLVTCDGDSNPTMNREKVGAVCKCSDGQCNWESKKADFKCIPDWKCPLPDFQGAKFNYVIEAEEGDDWAYMRFRFRPDFTKGFRDLFTIISLVLKDQNGEKTP